MKSSRYAIFTSFCCGLICWLFTGGVTADDLCVDCELRKLRADIAGKQATVAVDRLKNVKNQYPDRKEPVLLLAIAYNADDNGYWALNVLYEWYSAHAEDCEVLSFIVWQHIQMANVDDAKTLMAESQCNRDNKVRTRWHVINAYLNTLEDRGPQVKTRLPEAWPEDAQLWQTLIEQDAPGQIPPIDFHMSLETGVTTNAQAGSPLDSTGDPVLSATGRMEIEARFTAPTRKFVRPALGVVARLNGYTDDAVRKYSSMDIAAMPGVVLGRTTTLLLTYKGSLMLLAWPDKTLFRETHRAELELTHPSGRLLFANAGKRIYRENGRTRWELEIGYGRSKVLNDWTTLLFSVNGRYYDAIGAPYDQVGAGLLAAVQFSLPWRLTIKSGIGESADYFFHSGGDRGIDAFGISNRRRDWTMRHFDELWFLTLKNIKLGVRYEFNYRDSNADATASSIIYDYTEHRVLLKASIGLTANPLAPKVTHETDHIPLNYGLQSSQHSTGMNTRDIAEMLRADEAARAASSCVE